MAGVNILIMGTAGTGKTSTSELLQSTRLKHVDLDKVVEEEHLHKGWDEDYQSYLIKEKDLIRHLDKQMKKGGNIVDGSKCSFLPQQWFDLVVILQTDVVILEERLTDRGYTSQTVENHVEIEINKIPLEAALANYSQDMIMVLSSDSLEDRNKNVALLKAWVQSRDPSLLCCEH